MVKKIMLAAALCALSSAAHAHHRYHHHHHHHRHLALGHRTRLSAAHRDDQASEARAPVSLHSVVEAVTRPMRMVGELIIDGISFAFVSGGHGRWSIPYGDHRITPDEVGSWGRRHGAIGLAGGEIWDPVLHREREGIEIHPSTLYETHGCVGIDRRRWSQFKHMLLAMVASGEAWLHVTPAGVTITSYKRPIAPVAFADLV